MADSRSNEQIALERYKIISPILTAMEENADRGRIWFLKSEACGLAGVSRKTMNRWLNRYAQKWLEGLKYQSDSDVSKWLIPGELVKEVILLRREVLSRSIPQIIEILEMEGKAPKGLLKRSTLQDHLREAGYAAAQMKLYQQPGIAARRFVRFPVSELVIGPHTGPRPKLPAHMTDATPETSRLLDGKQKQFDNRSLPKARAISYAQINQGGEDHV